MTTKNTEISKGKALTSLIITVLFCTSFNLSAQSSENAYRIEKFAVNDGVNIDVLTNSGPIKVVGKNTDEITVEMYVRYRNNYVKNGEVDLSTWEIEISKKGNTITAHAKREGSVNWNRDSYSVGFMIYSPVNASTNLRTSGGNLTLENLSGTFNGKTSGGQIIAEGLRGEGDLHTSGGSIKLKDLEGTFKVNTSGGGITANQFNGSLDASTSGGSIDLQKMEGNVKARTSGGSIEAEILSPKEFIELRTSGGSITVVIPKEHGFDLDLDGSRVRADLENFKGETERDEVFGKLNGGGTRLKARTSGGSVSLRYL